MTKKPSVFAELPVKRGMDLLHDPLLNKGTAFTREERLRLGVLGLLPPAVSDPKIQAERVMGNVRKRATAIEKYVDMLSLLDRNTTLFYQVVARNIEELLPIIYTPTVGQGCQLYTHLFRRSRGIFITGQERGMVREVLRNWPQKNVRVIVVTDGERILGLGDLGANGMGIPVGKLSLYTAFGGIRPELTLPITLDVGTNNEALLKDPLYLGVRRRRLTGAAYDELLEEFVKAVQEVFPEALLQFEDFANHNAFQLLEKYKDRACCFNDDIQGTAAVTLAGLLTSGRITKRRLREEVILFHGAGEAAIGIANLTVDVMVAEGLSRQEAMRRCWFMDSRGLVENSRTDLQEHKRPYAHEHAPLKTVLKAVQVLKPTALIGVSGKAGEFNKAVVQAMARINKRPIVFALSNPTSNSECTAEQAYSWSGGLVIFASGSPFDPVRYKGRTFVPGQVNNAYIFPGVGMGVVVSAAKRVTPSMFLESARSLARRVSSKDIELGRLFPPLTDIVDVSARIAAAVAQVAFDEGLAEGPKPDDLLADVRARQYRPEYGSYA